MESLRLRTQEFVATFDLLVRPVCGVPNQNRSPFSVVTYLHCLDWYHLTPRAARRTHSLSSDTHCHLHDWHRVMPMAVDRGLDDALSSTVKVAE